MVLLLGQDVKKKETRDVNILVYVMLGFLAIMLGGAFLVK